MYDETYFENMDDYRDFIDHQLGLNDPDEDEIDDLYEDLGGEAEYVPSDEADLYGWDETAELPW